MNKTNNYQFKAYENMGKVFAAIAEGVQEMEWEYFVEDAKGLILKREKKLNWVYKWRRECFLYKLSALFAIWRTGATVLALSLAKCFNRIIISQNQSKAHLKQGIIPFRKFLLVKTIQAALNFNQKVVENFNDHEYSI